MQSEKDALIELYAGDAFKNRNNPDLAIGVWRQHFVEFADKLAALSSAESVAHITPKALQALKAFGFVLEATTAKAEGLNTIPLYAAPPAPSVAVKALEWKQNSEDWEIWSAPTILGPYDAMKILDKWEVTRNTVGKIGALETIEEAKAAAQADYEARIRSALSAQVQDVAELDEKTIVRLAWENFSESDYGRLTYERAPTMFPQAKYDVPTYALSQFVKAVRAAAPAKQEG